ncbi:MAG: acetyltransferase [Pseudomonadota bacterium]|nr:acetyltransferase [Pseudomonadota bacterium]
MTTAPLPEVFIYGAGGHARVVADAVAAAGQYRPVAAVTDIAEQAGATLDGLPVLHSADALEAMRDRGVRAAIVAIGQAEARAAVSARLDQAGLTLITAIHPRACVSPNATIARGCLVGAGGIVHAGTTLGEGAIVNTGAIVEHDCVIGAFAHIAPGAVVGGHARIGAAGWIGIGATVKDRIAIGERTVIGAGAVVVRDMPADAVAYGNPARVKPAGTP